ncbi:MAG: CPBP family intramembrane metalloprotease [Phycisphaerae bacterium]|nr:CPBP family intramembrane metalloprotease [Phycisphaerae bacterium]
MRDSIDAYLEASRRPLTILCFLLPAVLFYEVRLMLLSADAEGVVVNKAELGVLRFLEGIGIAGGGRLWLALPGAVLVAVLLLWHLIARDPWKVSLRTLGVMLLESAVMVAPLLVLARLFSTSSLMATEPAWESMGVGGKLAASFGAGLFEELVFRMLLLGLLHAILIDLLKLRELPGSVLAVAVAAILFAVYHPLQDAEGGLMLGRAVFYVLAGCWLGALMLLRGFGITVGAHALYDVVALLGT